jgi:hypothetical protein
MSSRTPRLERENRTVSLMIAFYCRHRHRNRSLCPGCRELLEYARVRLEKCPFQEGKTTCARCPVHCYRPEMRARIREVMRFSGPRMIYRHPVLAVRHLLDGRRKNPIKPDSTAK